MMHALILPLLLPLFAGSLLLAFGRRLRPGLQRGLSLLACWALVPLAGGLVWLAGDGQLRLYALGDWPAPFGIVLLLDRLAALMLLANAVLAACALLYACRGDDERGAHFHALFHFQLLGINGAFLTGDLFNLFVFFEILLIASYALLLHGNTTGRVRAGLHYVVLNLLGSALFLIAVSLLYGLTGTLNMADLAARVAKADAAQQPLLAMAGLLLLVVFGLKGAIVPLHVWLPRTYAAAVAPVAALFAILTKVGLYAIVRVFTLVFGSAAGTLAGLVQPWLWPLALLTLTLGAVGALAARELRHMLAWLVVVSVGTLLAGLALGTAQGMAAALYYLLHSTLVTGGLFLLADLVIGQRGTTGGELIPAAPVRQPLLLGTLFFAGAVTVVGLPPLSGFLAKLMLLRATAPDLAGLLLWAAVLGSGLVGLIALSRAGSLIFWRAEAESTDEGLAGKSDGWRLLACVILLLAGPLLVAGAAPLLGYLEATADQLLDLPPYLNLVGRGDT